MQFDQVLARAPRKTAGRKHSGMAAPDRRIAGPVAHERLAQSASIVRGQITSLLRWSKTAVAFCHNYRVKVSIGT